MILIFGKGKVGLALANLCDYQGISYEIHDDSDTLTSFDRYSHIIPSPGIPSHHPVYQTGKILAELDFAYQFLPNGFETVSVTGTDGKSTTSWILYNILEKEFSVKKPVYISGNFDIPFSATVLDILRNKHKKGIIVLEVSSFMSYAIKNFQSHYSIFTNLKTDHLNWHSHLQEYLDAKMRIVHSTLRKSIINKQVLDFASSHQLKIDTISHARIFQNGKGGKDYVDGDDIIVSGKKKYKLSETNFSGKHNAMNILSVALVANEMGICSKRIKEYFKLITGLPHRLEIIGNKRGIIIVEDSKSTSSQSLEAALSSFGTNKNILLIAGGSDKGDSFECLSPRFRERVKAMVCIGATKGQFESIAKNETIAYLTTDTLRDGVHFLYERGNPGDILMLSPGCASFGLFQDYLDRANQFRDCIKKLPD